METRRPDLVRALSQMGDFYMELKWDFQSWGEFVLVIEKLTLCHYKLRGVATSVFQLLL